jgi:hypothetical protein
MSATGQPVSAVGDSFVVHMDRESLNDCPEMGRYDVTVTITTWTPIARLRGRHRSALDLNQQHPCVSDRPGEADDGGAEEPIEPTTGTVRDTHTSRDERGRRDEQRDQRADRPDQRIADGSLRTQRHEARHQRERSTSDGELCPTATLRWPGASRNNPAVSNVRSSERVPAARRGSRSISRIRSRLIEIATKIRPVKVAAAPTVATANSCHSTT